MSEKVIPFPLLKLTDVAESLEALSGRVRRGEESMLRAVVVWEESCGSINYCCVGEEPFTNFMAVGMIEVAKHKIIDDVG